MKYPTYLVLFLLVLMLSCKEEKTDATTKEEVRIYMAWPGYTALPYYRWSDLDAEPKGPEPKLISEILSLKGYDYVFIPDYPYRDVGDPRIDALLDNAADVSIRGFSITDERKKLVDFSDSYFIDGLAVMIHDSSSIKTIPDLQGKRIFVYSYTTAYTWLKSNIPNAIVTTEIDVNINPWVLINQDLVDAYIYDYIGLKSIQTLNPDFGLKILDEKLTQDPLGIAVKKGDAKLLKDINDAIKTLKASGRLEAILSEYYNFKN
jgi:ABC-type amino acid transport substrate-binding protein